jgi:hypothetical protein
MIINGKWMSEPEILALISQLTADKKRLERKAKRLLGAALRTLNDGSCNKDCRQCKWNNNGCEYGCRFEWKYSDEVTEFIGDEST